MIDPITGTALPLHWWLTLVGFAFGIATGVGGGAALIVWLGRMHEPPFGPTGVH